MRPLPAATRGRAGFVALLAILLATGWAPAPQEGEIAVVGQVTNGTPDSSLPADLPVALHVFSGIEETETLTTTLAADGSFRFGGLALGEGMTFVVRVVYQDVAYLSDLGTFEPGQRELALPVTVYETTEDRSAIQVTQLHVFVSASGEHLQIGEYYLISNMGERTYVGTKAPEAGRRATLSFTLPEGAEGLRFDSSGLGERYLERERGFADTAPVPPGIASSEVLFEYQIPYREGAQVARVLDLPVASVVLVHLDEGIALEGEGITPAEPLDTQMGRALSYTAGPLAAGDVLAFRLVAQSQPTALTAPAGPAPARNAAQELGIGLVALAAAVVAVYLLWRLPAPEPFPGQARPLVEAIAALDRSEGAGGQGSRGAEEQGSGGATDEAEANSQP
jgi:hypothetical protein